eukprot:4965356-Amphidinium_carterae.1
MSYAFALLWTSFVSLFETCLVALCVLLPTRAEVSVMGCNSMDCQCDGGSDTLGDQGSISYEPILGRTM